MMRGLRICAVLLLPVTLACFITNCPPGGKRSNLAPHAPNAISRQCARCGPNMSGRCFGPSVCCSEGWGCVVSGASPSPSLLPCVAESLFPQPCTNGSPTRCGRASKGVCAAPGVCCLHNSCHSDPTCSKTMRRTNSFERDNEVQDDDRIFQVAETPAEAETREYSEI